jgi:hypothetical protein
MIGPAEIEEMMAEYAEAHGEDVSARPGSLLWPVLSTEPRSHPIGKPGGSEAPWAGRMDGIAVVDRSGPR